MTPRQLRAVGTVGLLSALCFLIGFVLDPTPPVAGASAAQIASHVAAYSALDRAAAVMFSLSGAGLIAFTAGLHGWFADISSAPPWWRTSLVAGGVATGLLLITASILFFTAASHPLQDAELATFVSDAVNYAVVFIGFGALVLVVSLTALMLATGGPLALLGRFGVVASAAQLLFLSTVFFTSGPLVAGGVVTILCFGVTALFVTFTALGVLWFARLMAAAARP